MPADTRVRAQAAAKARSAPIPRPSVQRVRPRLPPKRSLESKPDSSVNVCPRALDITGWTDRVKLIDAKFDGVCELPVIGVIETPAAALIRPDGHAVWVGKGDTGGLTDALGAWFGKAVME
ncbi:hypothetical protein [Mesorhizobium yinganensis]|uniref:aromatic-ring hydroxylase C-terminal domain-containing protein n=1 Tax=Mesorhizobium yinganensis TaxID=3157707 RepID=UPI003CCD693F